MEYDSINKKIGNTQNKKSNLFSFTKINRYFIFPFLSPIFIFIRDYLISKAKLKDNGVKATFQYEVMDGLMHSVCGIFYLIYFIRTRPIKATSERRNSLTFKSKESKNKNLKIFLLILVIGISYTIYISNSKILSKKYTVFEIRIYHLVFNTIFCRLILKYEVFSHQILSIILTLIGWILISIPIFQKISSQDIVPNIIFFFGAIFYPLYLVFFKFIIQKYYLSVFLNMLFIGIFLLIISIIGLLTYSLIDCNNLTYIKEIFDIAEDNKLFYFALLFGTIVKVIFCLIIYYFTPNIFVLTNVISSIINWIFNYFITKNKEETTLNLILQGIGYFIILFSTLIYNEFIIFNFCGLNKNTIKNISERSTIEEIELNMERISLGKGKDTGLYFEAGNDDEFIVTDSNSSGKDLINIKKAL
jgi:hypothetical protein